MIDQLLKQMVDISCKLNDQLGLDSGMRDLNNYCFVSDNELTYLMEDDVESALIHESESFLVASSPNWEYNLVVNKYYRSS